jgi:hypothetical protein
MNKVETLLKKEPMDATTFTPRDLEIFVECIMSGNISDKYVNKSILAIALTMHLSFEEYEIYVEDYDEDDDDDRPVSPNSEFFEFVDTCVEILEQKNAKQKWCLFLRDFLLNKEAYEVLGMLNLEGRYSI